MRYKRYAARCRAVIADRIAARALRSLWASVLLVTALLDIALLAWVLIAWVRS